MSSTNRGGQRCEADNYPTPAWCVRRLLEAVELPGIGWIEPACGDGAIIRAIESHFLAHPRAEGAPSPRWLAYDIRQECRDPVCDTTSALFSAGDFLGAAVGHFRVAITNPPYSQAQRFIERCLAIADVTVMLLRLNYLGSESRSAFMRANPPDVYVLPNRPAFVNGRTDSCEYAWFVWGQGGGRLRVLAPTPAAERRCAR